MRIDKNNSKEAHKHAYFFPRYYHYFRDSKKL